MRAFELPAKRVPAALIVFILSFAAQFAILISISGTDYFLPDSDDMKFYNDWARRIADGRLSDGKAFYGMPGFAYILGAFYKLTGYRHDFSPFVVAQFNTFCHALTSMFLFLIVRRTFADTRRKNAIGACASVAWLAMTSAQVFSAILMPTSWVICGFWGAVLFIMAGFDSRVPRRPAVWFLAGLVVGFIASTVATILMLLPLAILAIGFRGEGKRALAVVAAFLGAWAVSAVFSAAFNGSGTTAVVAVVVITAGALLRSKVRSVGNAPLSAALLLAGLYVATAPVWIHNRFVAKDTVFLSAHDGLNFYVGNHAEANGYTKIPSTMSQSQAGMLRDSELIPQRELGRDMKRSEISAYWKQKANAYIREHPAEWLALLGVKFTNFWNTYQYDDLSIIKLLRDEGAVPPGLRFGFVAALGLAGIPFAWRRWPASRWVLGAVALHIISLMPVFITERYRLTAAPGLILLAVAGLLSFYESLAAKKWAASLAYTAAVAIAAWFCTIPRGGADWALDYYKAGIRAIQTATTAHANGDAATATSALERAAKNLEIAYAHAPGSPEVNFALGNLYMQKNDTTRAEACYLAAVGHSLKINPARGHDGALTNLGILASRKNDWPSAVRLFSESLRFDEADGKTWFLLAEALAKTGDRARAIAAAERARALRPGDPAVDEILRSVGSP